MFWALAKELEKEEKKVMCQTLAVWLESAVFENLKQNEAQSACAELPTNLTLERCRTKQQRPESAAVTVTWHASKYGAHA